MWHYCKHSHRVSCDVRYYAMVNILCDYATVWKHYRIHMFFQASRYWVDSLAGLYYLIFLENSEVGSLIDDHISNDYVIGLRDWYKLDLQLLYDFVYDCSTVKPLLIDLPNFSCLGACQSSSCSHSLFIKPCHVVVSIVSGFFILLYNFVL